MIRRMDEALTVARRAAPCVEIRMASRSTCPAPGRAVTGVLRGPVVPVPLERLERCSSRRSSSSRPRTYAAAARRLLAARTVWNVNSTARGGGVAEMLHALRDYAAAPHGRAVAGGQGTRFLRRHRRSTTSCACPRRPALRPPLARRYDATLAQDSDEVVGLVQPGGVVCLHRDPQAADRPACGRCLGRVALPRGSRRARPGRPEEHGFPAQAGRARRIVRTSRRVHRLGEQRSLDHPTSLDPFSPRNADVGDQYVEVLVHRHSSSRRTTQVPAGVVLQVADGTGSRTWQRSSMPSQHLADPADVHLVLAVSRRVASPMTPRPPRCWPEVQSRSRYASHSCASATTSCQFPIGQPRPEHHIVDALQRWSTIIIQRPREEVASPSFETDGRATIVHLAIHGIQDQIQRQGAGGCCSTIREPVPSWPPHPLPSDADRCTSIDSRPPARHHSSPTGAWSSIVSCSGS